MSDIYTLSQLSDCLSQDLAWRKKELSILKTLIETKGFESSKKNVLMRSGVAVLYAHWEGYIKNSANAYLQFISKQKSLKYCEVKNNFIAIAMKKKLNEITETNKSTIHNQVINFLIEKMEETIDIPTKDVIKTKSNLSSQVLEQILGLLGIDYQPYETKQKLIDEKLLNSRNMVAHGEYLIIDATSYKEIHKEVIDMMDLFRDQIENSACQEHYLRYSTSNGTLKNPMPT